MPVQVTFLPDGGFYFDSTVRSFWCVPSLLTKGAYADNRRTEELNESLQKVLKGKANNVPQVNQILCLETLIHPDGSSTYFIRYKDTTGEIQTRRIM